MAVLTDVDPDEYIAYLTVLTKSDDRATAEQARDTLLKYGFNPAEPRAAGRWTSGGTTTTTSETSQRRGKERRRQQAQSRYDDAVQGNQVANRLARDDYAHTGYADSRAAREAARKKYRIPNSMRHMSPAKRAAAAAILRISVTMAHLKARQAKLAARVAAIDAEAGKANATAHTQATMARRRIGAAAALKAIDSRIAAEQSALSAAAAAWGKGHKVKKKSVAADLTKAEGDRVPKPGQKYWHGWIPVDAGLHDMLGYAGGRERHSGITYHASHRIETGNTPVDLHIGSYGDDAPEIGVETTATTGRLSPPSTASLDAQGARQAADHLRDLATIAESGEKPTTTKPTKHSRTADLIQNYVERNRIELGDKVDIDGEDLPITYKDLLALLAPHIPAPSVDEKRLRRVVKEKRDLDMDPTDLHMHLDTTGAQPIIRVTAHERGDKPWDPMSQDEREQGWMMSSLTPAQARELAEKLDQYASALPKPPKGA